MPDPTDPPNADIPPPSGVFVASVERAFRVVRAFDDAHSTMTLSEVAARVDLTRGTTRRFLQTLVTLGYVGTDGKRFWLAPRILDLGFAYLSASRLPQAAAPVARRISDATGESCSVAVLDGTQVVYVHRVQPRRIFSGALEIGSRLPAHASSLGQAILAHLPQDECDTVLAAMGFERFTDATLTDATALRDKLAAVRIAGAAFVDGELETGIASVAVPIEDRARRVVGALNIGTILARTSPAALRGHVPLLREGAAEIGSALTRD